MQGIHLALDAAGSSGTCGDVLTTLGDPSGWACALIKASITSMNFSASIDPYTTNRQRRDAAAGVFQACFAGSEK
jgi:hypothetical protein